MKIKLPSGIESILKRLTASGHQAYVVGGGVRDAILGSEPVDWDIATDAKLDTMLEVFPKAEVLSTELATVAVDETDDYCVDIAALRREGEYSDYKSPDFVEFTNSIEDDLRRRDYTVNAIAYSPEKGIVDPYSGMKDIEDKLIRTIGEPEERFSEDPIRILRGIRIAAECDFDIQKDVFHAMQHFSYLLAEVSKERLQEEFTKMLIGTNAGKGLRLSIMADVLPHIFGRDCYNGMSKQDKEDLTVLAESFNYARPEVEYRYALILRRLKVKSAEKAIDELVLSKKKKELISKSLTMVDEIYFLNTKLEMKRFIKNYGFETYYFLDRISRQEKKIFGRRDTKIESRHYMIQDMKTWKEPIFAEDLAIDGGDLIRAGIVEQGEEVGIMLDLLLDIVHIKPQLNEKEKLLDEANKFKRNKLKARFSKVRWIK